ncbi:MAG TPA: hypothetical protein VK735_15980 [Pseudonocardia sp.]|jgi:hypothetical protein|nr:hypothetical protein [Pseudonocardia sp.]HTF48945.1 hypothetical protein [Pseudonocardia sp.]
MTPELSDPELWRLGTEIVTDPFTEEVLSSVGLLGSRSRCCPTSR